MKSWSAIEKMFKPGCGIFRVHKPFQEYESEAMSESLLSSLEVTYHTEGSEDVAPVFLDLGEETRNRHWLNYIEQKFTYSLDTEKYFGLISSF